MQEQTQQLDPTVVNMARAIKSVETGGQSDPYNAKGGSGEYGAYQYTPDTWATDSQKYLGQSVPLQGATIEQQNRVAYGKINDLKNQGRTPLQVASIWNSGTPDPTGKVGVNSSGVQYDTPKYVNSVVSAYNAFKNGQNPQTASQSSNPTDNTTDESLGGQLSGRLNDLTSNLGDIANQLTGKAGSQGWWSDLIQSGGAVAGGVGDLVNAGLNLIPGVKTAENWLGGEIGKAADTSVGKTVVNAINQFSQAHPEISKDIGAGFNIATSIPILKGLGAVKDIAMSGLGSALKGVAGKGLTEGIVGTLGRTVGGRGLIDDETENVIKNVIINLGNIPDEQEGKYFTDEAQAKINQQIGDISTKELQPVLDNISATKAGTVPLSDLRDQALAEAKRKLQNPVGVNATFDRIQTLYGDNPTLSELNKAKILLNDMIPQRAFDLEGYNANYNVQRTLQKGIETAAKMQGLPDVGAINGKMRLLYKANDILENINGKPIKIGMLSKLARKGVSVGAGMIANQLGAGPVGALGTSYLADIADKGIQGSGGALRRAILNKTTGGILKKSIKSAGKIPGLIGAATIQRQAKR